MSNSLASSTCPHLEGCRAGADGQPRPQRPILSTKVAGIPRRIVVLPQVLNPQEPLDPPDGLNRRGRGLRFRVRLESRVADINADDILAEVPADADGHVGKVEPDAEDVAGGEDGVLDALAVRDGDGGLGLPRRKVDVEAAGGGGADCEAEEGVAILKDEGRDANDNASVWGAREGRVVESEEFETFWGDVRGG